jgi:hypothetical protein
VEGAFLRESRDGDSAVATQSIGMKFAAGDARARRITK